MSCNGKDGDIGKKCYHAVAAVPGAPVEERGQLLRNWNARTML
jgi:hypothetical protein